MSDADESLAGEVFERHRKTAERFGYVYRRSAVTPGSAPMVMFAGNHSSGKSTFVNSLVGATVQDTGVAPTDDSFTFIVHGEAAADYTGVAAMDRLPREFARLSEFGPSLVSRIRVKERPAENLRGVALLDTPGMIDSGERSFSRGYDFFGVMEFLAEISDLVLMIFDPDKPGTTGEAVEALKGPLAGSFFKLRILFNKCDLFDGIYDYARAYGALCWNLARVLPFKDLPKIYNCRLAVREIPRSVDLSDFDRMREEIVGEIRAAAGKRADNLRMAVVKEMSLLEMHVRMALRLRRALARHAAASFVAVAGGVLLIAAAGFAVGQTWGVSTADASRSLGAKALFAVQSLGVLAFAALSWFALRAVGKAHARLFADRLFAGDSQFEAEYARELALGGRDDLRQYWALVRPPVEKLVRARWRRLPFFAFRSLRRLARDIRRLVRA